MRRLTLAGGAAPSFDRTASPQSGPRNGTSRVEVDEDAVLYASYLFPELGEWLPVLARLSVSIRDAAGIAALARRNGTDFASELLARGLADEDAFSRAIADEFGFDYLASLDSDRLLVTDRQAIALMRRPSWHVPVRLQGEDGRVFSVIVPERIAPLRLRALMKDRSAVAGRLKLTSPRTMRAALSAKGRPALARIATADLFDRAPALSARIVANAWQGAPVGALLIALPVALLLAPALGWGALHGAASLFFLSCVALRLAVLRRQPPPPPLTPVRPAELPVYSVLVALYKEAEIVPALVEAMRSIVWPPAKLEIRFVCEEDDRPTLAALDRCALPRWMEVVKVPRLHPRTKPKALAYALPLVSGQFVALYDAEDRPNPLQLLQAWQAFDRAGADLACVQAPLEISNRGESIVATMFAFEYTALFRGLLPWLAARRLLLPLGGTSKHFRREALEAVGGWDPYNVTEDADLGLRLARFGYRTGTIDCPTLEPAPTELGVWFPQRTRWFKGWLQTWLVHMRNPFKLARDLSPASFLVAQILFAGMVVSALLHPLLLFTALWLAVDLTLARPMGAWRSILFAVDVTNVGLGYVSFLLLGWQALGKVERRGFWKIALLTPLYWLAMSAAAWRAVWQLCRAPHLWEKTPHVAGPAVADDVRQPLRAGLATGISALRR
jgi:cellulose synthase/poly-beta-1,6-N-acetylglucosamine synthase-like glycosyltransferase